MTYNTFKRQSNQTKKNFSFRYVWTVCALTLCTDSSPGTVVSMFPPASAAKSTTTDPSFMLSTIGVVIRMGARLPTMLQWKHRHQDITHIYWMSTIAIVDTRPYNVQKLLKLTEQWNKCEAVVKYVLVKLFLMFNIPWLVLFICKFSDYLPRLYVSHSAIFQIFHN